MLYISINFIESWRRYEMFTLYHYEMSYISIYKGPERVFSSFEIHFRVKTISAQRKPITIAKIQLIPSGDNYFRRGKLLTLGENYFRPAKTIYDRWKLFKPVKNCFTPAGKLFLPGENIFHRAKTICVLFPPGKNYFRQAKTISSRGKLFCVRGKTILRPAKTISNT